MSVDASSRVMRVLYLTDLHPSEKFGSLEEMILALAGAFRERGALFLPVFGAPLVAEAAAAYETVGLHAEWLNLQTFGFATLCHLWRLVRRHRIEVIDWNFYSPTNPYFLILSLLAPRLRHYRTDLLSRIPDESEKTGPLARVLKKILYRRYRRVLCISDFVLASLRRQKTWTNLVRCHLFINTQRFAPDATTRERLRKEMESEDRFVVLAVAHLIRWKGVDVALRALAELPQSAVLWVVGGGEEAASLRALCDKLSLTQRVRFLGTQRHVEPYMQAADCFVCPSVWAEALGLVNPEALASGLPVVASAIGGIPEFVEDGTTGLLFAPGDHRQLAAHLRRLMDDPEARRHMARAARKAAVENFSAQKRLPEYVDLFRA